MNFETSKRRTICVADNSDLSPHLKHNLQFYTDVPHDQVSLLDLIGLALERQKALQAVESAGQLYNKQSDEYQKNLDAELKRLSNMKILQCSMEDVDKCENVTDLRRKDNLSHFILMLAYCENKELRDWFITQETDLFKYRYDLENGNSIQRFLDLNNLNIAKVSDEEKEILFEELISATVNLIKFSKKMPRSKNFEDLTSEERSEIIKEKDFFKTPFLDVLDLVKSRKVLLRSGFAYVPRHELITIVAGKFRNKLSYAFAVTLNMEGLKQ